MGRYFQSVPFYEETEQSEYFDVRGGPGMLPLWIGQMPDLQYLGHCSKCQKPRVTPTDSPRLPVMRQSQVE